MPGSEPPLFAPRTAEEKPSVALGTMNFGKRTAEAEARSIIDRAIERGVRVFDTANAYVDGESERIVGRAIAGRRDRVVLATKVGFGRVAGKPEGLAPAQIRRAIEESLARLSTDFVDLYYLHVPDPKTPVESSVEAITGLVAAGKALTWGVSNYASWQILEMLVYCDAHRLPHPLVAQQLYNLLIRQLDLEYLRFAAKYRLHTTVYNPLAGGLLSGRYHPGSEVTRGSRFDGNKLYLGRYWTPAMLELVDRYAAVARDEGRSLVSLAYAWLAGTKGVDSILVGPGTVAHLDEALDAIESPLSPECRARIEGIHRAFLGTETTYAR